MSSTLVVVVLLAEAATACLFVQSDGRLFARSLACLTRNSPRVATSMRGKSVTLPELCSLFDAAVGAAVVAAFDAKLE